MADKKIHLIQFAVFSVLMMFVTGCAGSPDPLPLDNALLPMPERAAIIDPDDGAFMTALDDYIAKIGAPRISRYEFTRVDLNNDGRREGLAMMVSPFHYWCTMDGCAMVVFTASNSGFTFMSTVAPIRGPVHISHATTNGWRDFVVRVSGQEGWPAKEALLQFDGNNYPAHPAYEGARPVNYDSRGDIAIFP